MQAQGADVWTGSPIMAGPYIDGVFLLIRGKAVVSFVYYPKGLPPGKSKPYMTRQETGRKYHATFSEDGKLTPMWDDDDGTYSVEQLVAKVLEEFGTKLLEVERGKQLAAAD